MRGGKVETMTDKTKEVLRQLACYAVVGVVGGIGPVLPLTACLVCVGGTVIFIYLHKCMQGQPLRAFFLVAALLWLWCNTGVTLINYSNAPLALALLVLGCVLVTGAGRRARLGAFLLPVGALSLIPYGLRDIESGMAMAAIAAWLLIFGGTCYLCRALIPRRIVGGNFLRYGLPYVLGFSLIFGGLLLARLRPDEILGAIPGILMLLSPDWCAILCRRSCCACGVQNRWWLGILSALSCLAPLGFINFIYNIIIYF